MDGPPDPPEAAAAAETCAAVTARVGDAVVVDREVLETLTAAVLARGHVLVEDVPGTGKTLTARLLARALGLSFSRVQFTPDLLPSDVTGTNVYDEHAGEFSFAAGPVFANVVLADEINRAPPKTQAALLEAMEERQVTVDGETHALPEPFVVLATQNPVEQEGTFRLPEAQRDRFLVETGLGYPDRAGELELLDRRASRRTLAPSVEPLLSPPEVRALQAVPEDVHVDDALRAYVVDLGRATREDDRVATGVSPRGIQRAFEAARAWAVVRGRDYVVPEDVKAVAVPAMAHRLVLATEASVGGVDRAEVVRDVLDRVAVPGMDDPRGSASENRASRD
jgi:MoxR-like ATPase